VRRVTARRPARQPARATLRPARRRAARPRAGFTIVELIVAIIVLSVGVLALASSAGVMMRLMTDGNRQAHAASIAQSRFDSLASVGSAAANCNAIAPPGGSVGGTRADRGVVERWRATRTGAVTLTVLDSVRLPRTTNALVFGSVVRCQP
jgi:prepilin-type N-terminal cleavage/methylation domain-containing protein